LNVKFEGGVLGANMHWHDPKVLYTVDTGTSQLKSAKPSARIPSLQRSSQQL